MSAVNPPVNGVAFIVYIALQDMANPGSYKANPTIAAGDFQVSIDGGAFANLATLPTVTPAAGRAVKISLSAAEMTGDNIFIQCVDQTNPKEWSDYAFNIQTVAAAPYTGGAVASVTGNVGGNVTGSVGSVVGAVGSVTGAVGSVTGNVGGNVVGSVGSVVGAVGSVSGAVGSVTGNVGGNVNGNVAGSVASVTADVGITQGGADKVWLSAARTLTSFGTLVADVATAVWASAARTLTSFGTLTADVADKLLGRNLAGGSDGGRTVQDALRVLRNKRSIAAGTLTVTAEDDTTPAWTAAVTTAVSNPVNSIDPA